MTQQAAHLREMALAVLQIPEPRAQAAAARAVYRLFLTPS